MDTLLIISTLEIEYMHKQIKKRLTLCRFRLSIYKQNMKCKMFFAFTLEYQKDTDETSQLRV